MHNLRNMETHDLSMVLSWRNHENVRKYMYTQSKISEEEHAKWWQTVKRTKDCKYLIYEADGIPLGVISFNAINLMHKRSTWAFYASSDAPKGSGSKMEFLALNYAFGTLLLRKLSCEVLSYNSSVISMHKKFGFEEEGRFLSHFWIGEQSWDVIRLATFKENWEKRRSQFEYLFQ